MKKCAYCGNEANLTGEHVIPNGLLKLFPEQDITFSNDRMYKDNEGSTINDVCAECNNDYLGVLDSYGLELIKNNFLVEFEANDILEFEYNYDMLSRWLLKIAYNTDRVYKLNNKILENSVDYILHSDETKKPLFSLFAGLHVDMTAFGIQNEGLYYTPLQVIREPILCSDGIILEYLIRNKKEDFDVFALVNAATWYVFRFAGANFLLILWKDNALESINLDKIKFLELFPYAEVLENDKIIKIERVTDNFTCKNIGVIDGKKGIELTDDFIENVLHGRSIYDVRKEMANFFTPEQSKKGRILNELLIFPTNKKLKMEYKKIFDEDK